MACRQRSLCHRALPLRSGFLTIANSVGPASNTTVQESITYHLTAVKDVYYPGCAARASLGPHALQQIPMTMGARFSYEACCIKTLEGWCVRINSPDRQRWLQWLVQINTPKGSISVCTTSHNITDHKQTSFSRCGTTGAVRSSSSSSRANAHPA
jgi:hypothetical protein